MDDIPYVLLLNVDAQGPLCCYMRSADGHACKSCFLLLKKELLALACIGLEAFFIHFLATRRVTGRPCGGAGAVGARLGVHFMIKNGF